jgi:hypothetical protein
MSLLHLLILVTSAFNPFEVINEGKPAEKKVPVVVVLGSDSVVERFTCHQLFSQDDLDSVFKKLQDQKRPLLLIDADFDTHMAVIICYGKATNVGPLDVKAVETSDSLIVRFRVTQASTEAAAPKTVVCPYAVVVMKKGSKLVLEENIAGSAADPPVLRRRAVLKDGKEIKEMSP